MTKNLYLIGGVIAVFVISALMFYHHQTGAEGFTDIKVPADLNRAPIAAPNMAVPTSLQRPTGIPGPSAAPRKAIATPKELQNLDADIMVWLDAASQLEREHPSGLSPEQRQQRVLYQSRIRSIRNQLGIGKIEDTSAQVALETLELRDQNAIWSKPVTSLEAAYKFGQGKNADANLDPAAFKEFRALFEAGLNELKGNSLADPLQTVRQKQLEVMEQELKELGRRAHDPIPIKYGAARLYLQQMLQPTQPLPSLISHDFVSQKPFTRHETDPANILPALKDIQWSLTVQYNPGEQALMKSVAEMIRHFESGASTPEDVVRAREEIVDLQNRRGPRPVDPYAEAHRSHHRGDSPYPNPNTERAPLLDETYDPDRLIPRAIRLCDQIDEAFPDSIQALGCPRAPPTTRYEAETIINTVCDRIRTSVPTVTPEQFNCPRPNRNV